VDAFFFFAMKDVDACDKDCDLFLLKWFTLNRIGMYMTVTGCKMLVIRNGDLFLLKWFTLNRIGMYMTVTGCKMLVIDG
jgi:hypothetical protein